MSKTSILDENPRLRRIITEAQESPSPAIALTIATVRRQEKDKVYSLVGWEEKCFYHGDIGHFVSVMRRPETNVTHPNILSAPTDRIPHALFRAITDGPMVNPIRTPSHRGYAFYKPRPVSSEDESGHHPIVYAVDSILAKKMGVAEALEAGKITYRAWLAAVLDGHASYKDCVDESMRMANIFVEVDEASMGRFPSESGAYSEIRKITLQDFMAHHWYGAKGGEFFSPPNSGAQTEVDHIDGLCLPSSLEVLRQFEGSGKQGQLANAVIDFRKV